MSIATATLTAASLRESLASDSKAFKVGPIRSQGEYHGRVLSGFVNDTLADHAASILRSCDNYDVTPFVKDGAVSLAVIARKA